MLNVYANNKVSYQAKQSCSLISAVAFCKQRVRTIRNVQEQDQSDFQKISTYFEDFISSVLSEDGGYFGACSTLYDENPK